MVSDLEKDENSIWDMSADASSRQININSIDPASTELIAERMKRIKELSKKL
jgi:hypothetical protein